MSAQADKKVIVVCGFPRSGTSLMMQMLYAAGVKCAGEWPAFEPEETQCSPSAAFVKSCEGGAFKLLDPHRLLLPPGFAYDFIWMQRNRYQQAKSLLKFMRACGVRIPMDSRAVHRLTQGLRDDLPNAERNLRSHPGCRLIVVTFEGLIDNTASEVVSVSDYFGLPVRPMAQCVRQRSSQCLDYMLELKLLEELPA